VDEDRPSVFTWGLATVYSVAADEADTVRTPVMRGDVFAARKDFLDRIGGFDEHLRQARRPGYHVELSFRWDQTPRLAELDLPGVAELISHCLTSRSLRSSNTNLLTNQTTRYY